ncbi:RES family NAD+ phosphorylase [Pseudoroseomonas wenyumeiae]
MGLRAPEFQRRHGHLPARAALGRTLQRAGPGAWYAAASLRTAAIEVAHHLRREAVATGAPRLQRAFRTYTASLAGITWTFGGSRRRGRRSMPPAATRPPSSWGKHPCLGRGGHHL